MESVHPLARDDVEIVERQRDDEIVYIIGDPIKNAYHELDELQFEIFRRLDGKTSLPDIVRVLVTEFEVDVDVDELSEFIGNLASLDLLDASSDLRLDGKDGQLIARRVQRQLEVDGVVFAKRSASRERRKRQRTKERRHRWLEAGLMDAALTKLERGEIRMAAAFLRTLLETEPRNHRARYLLHVISAEHFGKPENVDSIWFFRVPLVNPEPFLRPLSRVFGRLIFNWLTLLFCLGAIASALLLAVLSFDVAAEHVLSIISDESPARIAGLFVGNILANLLITLGHELMHGFACLHFGGRARQIGLLFAYLSPGAYCDISSTYMLENKWQRAMVSLVGPLWDLSIAAALVFLYMLGQPDAYLTQLSLFLVPVLAYGSLMNLHPLVKNDAYLALTDLLEYPNLREDAFTYLTIRVQELLFGRPREVPEELYERRGLLLWYSVPAIVVTTAMVTGAAYVVTTLLVTRLYGLGVVLSALLVGLLVYRVFGALLRAAVRHRQLLLSSTRVRRAALALTVLSALVLVAPLPERLEAPFSLRHDTEPLRALETATIARVYIEDGARVEEGETLLTMQEPELERKLLEVEAELAAAEQELARVMGGRRQEELDVQRAALAAATAEEASAAASVRRLQPLVRGGLVPQSQYDAALAAQAEASTRRRTALNELRALAADAEDSVIRAAQATLASRQAEYERTLARVQSLELRAPTSGVVRYRVGVRREPPLGVRVERGETVLEVYTGGESFLAARVPLHQPISLIDKGDAVEAQLVGAPGVPLVGRVRYIGERVERDPRGAPYVYVEASVEGLDATLPEGLGGTLLVRTGRRPVALQLYERFVRLFEIDVQEALGRTEESPSAGGGGAS